MQLPLPPQIDANRVLVAISPAKDVDAFHPENVGRLVQGRPRFLPCTPQGVQQLLMRSGIEIAGRHVVILGRSDIVGRPLSIMLSQRGPGGDATVTLCHSRTPDLAAVTKTADILVVAIGRPKFVTADMVRPGAVVVDVGINRAESGVVGDVDFAAVREVAGAITPVPGRHRAAYDRDAAEKHAFSGTSAGNVGWTFVRRCIRFCVGDVTGVGSGLLLRLRNVILMVGGRSGGARFTPKTVRRSWVGGH